MIETERLIYAASPRGAEETGPTRSASTPWRAPMNDGIRIAMWSGPRNISTALLRSWGSRGDTAVCDEPLYAHYLHVTGLRHPGREEVLASQPTDWREVVAGLVGRIPGGRPIYYQKQMAHHLLPDIGRAWLDRLRHGFLIREPREMLASLLAVTPGAEVADTGLVQQWELFRRVRDRDGRVPPVVDSRDVLEDPRGTLTALCAALDVPFDPAMLSWKPGPRATDGVWAPHWYASVERSTGFRPYRPKSVEVPPERHALLAVCEDLYRRLHRHRLRPGGSDAADLR